MILQANTVKEKKKKRKKKNPVNNVGKHEAKRSIANSLYGRSNRRTQNTVACV